MSCVHPSALCVLFRRCSLFGRVRVRACVCVMLLCEYVVFLRLLLCMLNIMSEHVRLVFFYDAVHALWSFAVC